MKPKKRFFLIKRPNLNSVSCVSDLNLALEEVRLSYDEGEPGEFIILELVEMTEDELDALPDFEGW